MKGYEPPSRREVESLIAKLAKRHSKSRAAIRRDLATAAASVLLQNKINLLTFTTQLLDTASEFTFFKSPHPDSTEDEIRIFNRVKARYESASFALHRLGIGLIQIRLKHDRIRPKRPMRKEQNVGV